MLKITKTLLTEDGADVGTTAINLSYRVHAVPCILSGKYRDYYVNFIRRNMTKVVD